MSAFQKARHPRCWANRKSAARSRFYAKVEVELWTGCWLWNGHVGRGGYGQFGDNRGLHYAHRWAYTHFRGPIPDGMHIDHLCNNRRCVNPDHLEPVTQGENNQRSWDRRKAAAS